MLYFDGDRFESHWHLNPLYYKHYSVMRLKHKYLLLLFPYTEFSVTKLPAATKSTTASYTLFAMHGNSIHNSGRSCFKPRTEVACRVARVLPNSVTRSGFVSDVHCVRENTVIQAVILFVFYCFLRNGRQRTLILIL
jgi:hypothetical protein